MANPVYLSKNLVAASSTGIGIISSAGVVTLNTSKFDTQRRVTIWSTGATLASATFTVVGTREGAGIVTETITGVTSNAAVATTQDYLSVTAVSVSSVITNQATLGTNTQGGTPWQSVNLHITPVQIGGAIVFTSTANGVIGQIDLTMDNPFLAPPAQVPGGLPYPINAPPAVFTSTAFSSATNSNDIDGVNVIGTGLLVPITAWRLTITSSSSGAGTVNFTAIQAGIG